MERALHTNFAKFETTWDIITKYEGFRCRKELTSQPKTSKT